MHLKSGIEKRDDPTNSHIQTLLFYNMQDAKYQKLVRENTQNRAQNRAQNREQPGNER